MSYWVIIEAGSKQRYIFSTNKRRANIGASQIISDTADWVRDALTGCQDHEHAAVEVVVLDSGKANLIAGDHEGGRCVVGAVTGRALREAPGLDIWGSITSIEDSSDPGGSLDAAYADHARARATRATPLLRSPGLPVTMPCRQSGLPATDMLRDTGLDGEGDESALWVSREFRSIYGAGNPRRPDGTESDSRKRLASYLPDAGARLPELILCNPDKEFTSWVGVMHADGDGVGALFAAIGRGDSGGTRSAEASENLKKLTLEAFREAVVETDKVALHRNIQDWLLPLIVGGDDVTVLLDGRLALAFTQHYCQAFDTLAVGSELCQQITQMNESQPDELRLLKPTVSAGLAIVKPHHPFSDAIALAEDLCSNAKTKPGWSTFDVHVLFDSVGRELSEVREPLNVRNAKGGPLQLWGGPFDSGTAGQLEELIGHMTRQDPARPALIGGTVAHRLRTALSTGGPAIRRATEQAKLRDRTGGRAWAAMEPSLPSDHASNTIWLDAIALSDVAEGASR